MNTQAQAQPGGVTIPETPKILIFLALLFVPGVYIVLLLSGAMVIGIGGYILYWIIKAGTAGHISGLAIKVGIVVGLGVIAGSVAVIKGIASAIIRKPEFTPAISLNLAKEPQLGFFISKLCMAMGTKSPDAVILHAEPTFFVTQGKLDTFNGRVNGRILAIGLPLLGGLTVNELRSILSHEFAHFTGNDTLYSSCVLPVYVGSSTACIEMIEAIQGAQDEDRSFFSKILYMIPMLLPRYMLELYLRMFSLLDSYISRDRERRADAIAVSTCGSQSFTKGLTKSVGIIGVYNDEAANNIIDQACNQGKANNYYTGLRALLPSMSDLAKEHAKKAYEYKENKYDSHPSLKSRISANGQVPERYEDTAPSASLFANLEEYENTMHNNMSRLMAMINNQ